MTKGSIGYVQNSGFTSVLSVRQARSDERVVRATGAIPAPQTEKEYILTLFQTISSSALLSAVFDQQPFKTAIDQQPFKTAITSAELSAVFDDDLERQPSLQ